MQILVTAATKTELELYDTIQEYADILITGVGVPEVLYHLQKHLHQKKYDLVIQAGIAGTFTDKFELGDTVIVKQDIFADIGFEESSIFSSIYNTSLADKNAFPYGNGWLINKTELINKLNLPLVKSVTVNTVSDSNAQKIKLVNHFAPDIETMEGAAMHFVCLHENIPFIQLRSISNDVGVRDKSLWKIKEAITNLNEELIKILKLVK